MALVLVLLIGAIGMLVNYRLASVATDRAFTRGLHAGMHAHNSRLHTLGMPTIKALEDASEGYYLTLQLRPKSMGPVPDDDSEPDVWPGDDEALN